MQNKLFNKEIYYLLSQIKNIVYVAGEAQTCFALNQYFIENLNWNKEDIRVKKFWTSRKAEK